MPELRKDPLTGRLVSYAPERAKRPIEISEEVPSLVDDPSKCPFCPGKEDLLAPATLVLVRAGSGIKFDREVGVERKLNWLVKCVPNLYPAFSRDDLLRVRASSMRVSGIHEVLIDTPRHDGDPWSLTVDQMQLFLLAVRERLAQLESEPSIKFACFGKNHGPHSGGSLRHPHTHIFAMPITPPLLEIESRSLSGENCLLCRLAKEPHGPRSILSTSRFSAVCPWASREPYEIMIFPKVHAQRFIDIDDEGLFELSTMFSAIFKSLKKVLRNPSFNLVLHTKPKDSGDFHWHIEIVPRVLMPMVSEIGLNVYVNTVFPEEAAEKLRSAVEEL